MRVEDVKYPIIWKPIYESTEDEEEVTISTNEEADQIEAVSKMAEV